MARKRKFKSRMRIVNNEDDIGERDNNSETREITDEREPETTNIIENDIFGLTTVREEAVETSSELVHYPKTVFVIPYRDRQEHLNVFLNHMNWIMKEKGWKYNQDYTYIISSQQDQRTFNRGAMKNWGFYYAREKWPEYYKQINFVFNDVDVMPGFAHQVDYETVEGIVKHSYGFDFCLGGLVTIKGSDFERINGYPNYWGWGYEDNMLGVRCNRANIIIDREKFWKADSKEFIRLNHGKEKIVDKKLKEKYYKTSPTNGLSSLKDVLYFDNSVI